MKLLEMELFARFRDRRDVKVLRHKDTKLDLWAMRGTSEFEKYQNIHGRDVFRNARFIISFIAERQKFGKFVGVWEVLSKKPVGKGFRYVTRELPGFKDMEGRLVVHWGKGTRVWVQWLHRAGNKDVSEILPPGYVKDFPGFYDFVLRHDQLVRMMNNKESNREWYRMLSSVSGVYVILDTVSGRQYIGSAYGVGGIWGRWRQYAKTKYGGNILLKKLLAKHPDRYKKFQFALLRVLEPGITKEAVIDHETMAKRKLGSRAFGLNAN